MLSVKRVLVATICGFVFGLVCMGFASSNPESADVLTASIKWNIILSRTLMGFIIGVSALRLNWWLHGIVIGFIASIPMAVTVAHRMDIFIGTFVMGMIYGVLTELITSVLFKAKSPALS
jgi:hypothetical protein